MTNISRNYDNTPAANEWIDSSCTHPAVAMAIHAIADSKRSANAIWESPTPAEDDHVHMAVQEYLSHGDFEPTDDSRYRWGIDSITVAFEPITNREE